MASSFTIIALFSVALFAGIIESRKDPGEYWQGVAKNDESSVTEVMEHLVKVGSALSNLRRITGPDYHTGEKKSFVNDFEPRPNVSAYGEDGKLKEGKSFVKDLKASADPCADGTDAGRKGENKFDKDFEPRPSATRYQE